jgi:hypothetical protein
MSMNLLLEKRMNAIRRTEQSLASPYFLLLFSSILFIKAFSLQTFHSNQTLNKTSADMRLTLTDGQF